MSWWINADICWCADSNECEDIKCYRHMKNRKREEGVNIFTSSCLKGTDLCPSYFSLDLAKEEENVSN